MTDVIEYFDWPVLLRALAAMIFLALFVESGVEYFLATPLKKNGKPTWYLIYVSLLAGVLVCVFYRVDLPAAIGLIGPAWLGYGIAGAIVSRGANFVSDIAGGFVKALVQLYLYLRTLVAGNAES